MPGDLLQREVTTGRRPLSLSARKFPCRRPCTCTLCAASSASPVTGTVHGPDTVSGSTPRIVPGQAWIRHEPTKPGGLSC